MSAGPGWFFAAGAVACGSCRRSIPAGEPVRRSGRQGASLRCASCAQKQFGEDVPEDLHPASVETSPAPQPSLGLGVTRTSQGLMTVAEANRRARGRLARQQYASPERRTR